MLGVAAAAAAMLMAGCQEEKESPTLMSLAVNDTTMNITAKAGSEHVLVYSKSRWKVAFEEAADWLTLDRAEGEGNGEFIVKFTENAGLMRRAKLLISASGVDKVIPFTINQEGALGNPKLSFAVTEKTYIAWAVSDALEFNANVPEDEIKAVASEDWITDLKIEDGKLNLNVAENTTGQDRTAALSLEYTDIDKNVYRAVATISQTAQAGHLVLDETSMTVEAYEAVKYVPWDCVLGTFMPALKLSVEYEGAQSDWITDLAATEENLTFTIAVHVATVLSTLVVLWKEVSWIFKGLFRCSAADRSACGLNEETRYVLNIIVSMIPVGIVGVFFKDYVESIFGSGLVIVGSMLLVTACLLTFSYFARPRQKERISMVASCRVNRKATFKEVS